MRAAICNALKYSSLAAVIAIAGASVAAAQERVTWTELANVAVRGNTLEKTRGCDGCGDAGATSTQVIESNGGYVEFRIPEDWTYLVAGLAFRTRGTRFEDIEFGIRFNGNGSADIVESGRYIGGDTDYQAGDTFRIEVVNDRVRYLRNGNLMTTSRRRPTFPSRSTSGSAASAPPLRTRRMGAGRADDRGGARRPRRVPNPRSQRRRRHHAPGMERQPARVQRARCERRRTDHPAGAQRVLSAGRRGRRSRRRWNIRRVDSRQRQGPMDRHGPDRSRRRVDHVRSGRHHPDERRPGDTANPAGSRRSAPEALVRNSPAGTLIARIGNGAPFAVGARRTIARAPANGRLFLGVNDDYLDDNDGEFRVMVSIDSR